MINTISVVTKKYLILALRMESLFKNYEFVSGNGLFIKTRCELLFNVYITIWQGPISSKSKLGTRLHRATRSFLCPSVVSIPSYVSSPT
ncbi:hypothetical protein BpHYR1_052490 [Brachionus plicatilis]|uniref:Uncharacterized protein n=1 Tax=Brachionus plicatilis TaxID=10195 RepID=A0A3M7R819_BRAPC|nr:hypothetical protein BpHYR1_052490 [Brachionus plicatilis]